MDALANLDVDALYRKLIALYGELGYPAELVGHWSLPHNDLADLLALIDAAQPQRVLEVGTFIGFSTLVMASRLGGDGHIHTVDPDMPMRVELSAMGTRVEGADVEVQPQHLAHKAAAMLELDDRITFHAGGFSTGATFASANADPNAVVPVVGPAVCRAKGPFDFAFIDGLHYAEAVLSDLQLAAAHLQPGGHIVIHDVIGRWGSNVRRAVSQFLVDHPQFVFQHARYDTIYRAIGVLRHVPQGVRRADALAALPLNTRPAPARSSAHSEMMRHLACVLVAQLKPRSVIQFNPRDGELLQALQRFGAERCVAVCPPDNGVQIPGVTVERHDFGKPYATDETFDLVICLGATDDLELGDSGRLIEACAAAGDTVLFGCTPPGEAGIAGAGARPLAHWMRQFHAHNMHLHDEVRPLLEPLTYAFAAQPEGCVQSSNLVNLYLARRDTVLSNEAKALALEKEQRIEDLSLQAAFADVLIRDTLRNYLLMAEQNARLQETCKALKDKADRYDELCHIDATAAACETNPGDNGPTEVALHDDPLHRGFWRQLTHRLGGR